MPAAGGKRALAGRNRRSTAEDQRGKAGMTCEDEGACPIRGLRVYRVDREERVASGIGWREWREARDSWRSGGKKARGGKTGMRLALR